jgi:hypothetical protein
MRIAFLLIPLGKEYLWGGLFYLLRAGAYTFVILWVNHPSFVTASAGV